ncbi:putative lipoprotein [Corallococcus coralloides]|uniref:Putative lipoprotein n=1 Tax=Corallococcus coralloides TaxID=184914 RepID=A0A410RXC9_CORCK|nr:putative metal-binding motif-containing protein [Corallococcus coralloides]QAT86604.1 putative lipoprotein [Corallococcus coralloides]
MSRFRVLWVSLLGLALVRCTVPSLEDLWRERGFCALGDEDCGMLRIRVESPGFVPGCVRFVARDDASDAELALSVPRRPESGTPSSISQGFSPPKSWGLSVRVSVEAFSSACEGAPVSVQSQKASLKEGQTVEVTFVLSVTDADQDGFPSRDAGGSDCDDTRADVHPGATERCNGVDDDCDNAVDEEFGVGGACSSGEGCAGVRACQPDGTAACVVPVVQYAWADEDGDGHGDVTRGAQPVCTATLPSNRLPTTAPHDDCLDTNAGVYPGAPERCNGLDDNCNGAEDEGFFVGTSCVDNSSGCHGVRACNPAGTDTLCQLPASFPTWYPDDDEDSFGQTDAGVVACSPPGERFVSPSGDCDDGNPFTHPGGRELCDSQDNDCDGIADEGTCVEGSPRWAWQTIGDGGTRWYGVSQYGDGGVWIVGSQAARAFKQPGDGTFTLANGACTSSPTPPDLLSVWAHPNGNAYMMGSDSHVVLSHGNNDNCGTRRMLLGEAPYGSALQGFPAGYYAELHGVSTDMDASVAGVFQVDGGSPPYIVSRDVGPGPLRGLHGQSPETMFAVGGRDAGVIYRYSPGARSWSADTTVPAVSPLHDVRVVNSRLAYAVGAGGTVLVWDGVSWSRHVSPSGGDLTDVLAFGRNSIYVLNNTGTLFRYDGRQWSQQKFVGPVHDIEGTSPEDIWIVGYPGIVFHYPLWPQ